MAVKSRKTKKKVSRSSQVARRKRDYNKNENAATLKVIGNIIAIFIAIFVAISNFSLGGSIGSIVRSLVLSCFGTFGHFFPIILVLAVIFNIAKSENESNAKIYALLVLYVMIISMLTVMLWDYDIQSRDFFEIVNDSVSRANGSLSFTKELFSGGAIATSIAYFLIKAMGTVGSMVLLTAVSFVLFIELFGLSILNRIFRIIIGIFTFIPHLLRRLNERREEDNQIAIDNEKILRETYEKMRKGNMQVTFDKSSNGERLVLEPMPDTKKHFDTSNVSVTTEDIQSRLFDAENPSKNFDRPQSHLLKELKKKSINEILYEEKEKGNESSEFFYREGMRPVDELDNIVLPKPNISDKPNNYNTLRNDYDEDNSDSIYNDENNFTSELSELRRTETIVKNDSSATLRNVEKDGLELKNNLVKDNDEFEKKIRRRVKKYKSPPLNLLNKSDLRGTARDPKLNEKANLLVETLKTFGVGTTLLNITVGPAVTRYELRPDVGVKVSKILSLENDVQLALAASSLKIEAPIPGKAAIGIEIANEKSSGVLLGDIISTSDFRNAESKLTVAIGKDISGKAIVTDLRKMPHLLIAGATGSGKSVCVNSLITSLIYKSSPEDVRLIMVDPKMVELQIYDGIPHLLVPVITDAKKAASALHFAVSEMTRRYNLIQERRVRDIESYNQAIEGEISKLRVNEDNEADLERVTKLPYIVIIIDEFADLMMVASKEVENAVGRIAQLARACGIYLVMATQRPSVNFISGSIKANIPSRIAFAVASGIDSQTILDRRGAEKLLGRGDMLYFPTGYPEPVRVQGCYVSEEEILKIVDYVRDDSVVFDETAEKIIDTGVAPSDTSVGGSDNDRDEKFVDAGRLIVEQQNASIGMIQRRFAMGFNRAARIIDQLESEGVISRADGKKPREVLMTIDEFNGKFGG